jgi:hypothetical protein
MTLQPMFARNTLEPGTHQAKESRLPYWAQVAWPVYSPALFLGRPAHSARRSTAEPEHLQLFFVASTAENFRSTCGSDRGAPECSTHRSPAATPHVGQGTEDSCLGVSSFLFTRIECDNTQPRNCSMLYTFGIRNYSMNRDLYTAGCDMRSACGSPGPSTPWERPCC